MKTIQFYHFLFHFREAKLLPPKLQSLRLPPWSSRPCRSRPHALPPSCASHHPLHEHLRSSIWSAHCSALWRLCHHSLHTRRQKHLCLLSLATPCFSFKVFGNFPDHPTQGGLSLPCRNPLEKSMAQEFSLVW